MKLPFDLRVVLKFLFKRCYYYDINELSTENHTTWKRLTQGEEIPNEQFVNE